MSATDYFTLNCNREFSKSILSNIPNLQLYGYSDVVFTDIINKKLTFSHIYKLVNGPVIYKLNKQSIFTTSTTEVEYIVIINTVKEAL